LNINPHSAYLLVTHGSRDPRPQIGVKNLAKLLEERLINRGFSQKIPIETACLELAEKPLHQQIIDYGDRLILAGYQQLKIIPLFLLAGVHVMDDIPAEINKAKKYFTHKLNLELLPYIGSETLGLTSILANKKIGIKADAWILLAHGSNRIEFKQPIEVMANRLNAVTAYWSIAPNLTTQITALVNYGYKHIGILPYFLFEGGITDAIANICQQFPEVNIYITDVLGTDIELVKIIAELI
jgi:sirohydrochlorin cobaltochelatase